MQLSQSCGCQRNHLFDCSRLIMGLNWNMANYHANIRHYAKMSEAFLDCKTERDFQKILFEYMPERSFVCLSSDLKIGGNNLSRHLYQSNTFTFKMKSIMKLNGKIITADCSVESIIPDFCYLCSFHILWFFKCIICMYFFMKKGDGSFTGKLI